MQQLWQYLLVQEYSNLTNVKNIWTLFQIVDVVDSIWIQYFIKKHRSTSLWTQSTLKYTIDKEDILETLEPPCHVRVRKYRTYFKFDIWKYSCSSFFVLLKTFNSNKPLMVYIHLQHNSQVWFALYTPNISSYKSYITTNVLKIL